MFELTWIPVNIHLRETCRSTTVSANFPIAHVARVRVGIMIKQFAFVSCAGLNPTPESTMIDRLNVGLDGEYVKGPGVVEHARLGKLLRGER